MTVQISGTSRKVVQVDDIKDGQQIGPTMATAAVPFLFDETSGTPLKQRGTAEGAAHIAMRGRLITLLPLTTITNNNPVVSEPIPELDQYSLATITMTVTGKNMDALTTLDTYIQYSPNGGVVWDDIAHYTQMTDSVLGNGTYVLFLNANGIPTADRAVDDAATIVANTVRAISWCDRMRVKCVGANFAGTDTVTIKVEAYLQ